MAKPIRSHYFEKEGVPHIIVIQRTGNTFPQPLRIMVDREIAVSDFWGEGKDWKRDVDRDETNEVEAHSLYDSLLAQADHGSVVDRLRSKGCVTWIGQQNNTNKP